MPNNVKLGAVNIIFFPDLKTEDRKITGGKAYSLGVLTQKGVSVPSGFAVTTNAFNKFSVDKKGSDFDSFKAELQAAFKKLGVEKVAVRSSAIAEDSDAESWAGQLESYLNVDAEHLVGAVEKCWDSIKSERIKTYTKGKNIAEEDLAVGVVVQAMVPSEASGVMFTSDPLGKSEEILIEAGLGLGEAVVQSLITPDQYWVNKNTGKIAKKKINKQELIVEVVNGESVNTPLKGKEAEVQKLSDKEIVALAKQAVVIEAIYEKPMDIEWAKHEGSIYIVQARPVTVMQSSDKRTQHVAKELAKDLGEAVVVGLGASHGVVSGRVKVIHALDELSKIGNGDILVTKTTTPDYVAVFDKIVGAVTDTGGFTSHTALVSREIGIPAVVGSGSATKYLKDGDLITIDGFNGLVFKGKTDKSFPVTEIEEEYAGTEPTGDIIVDFLNAVTTSNNDVSELWPLKPVQLFGYIDVSVGLDMLAKMKKAVLEEKLTPAQVAALFDRPDQIRLFLNCISISGLKVARRLGLARVTIKDQVDLTTWLLEALQAKVPNDSFSLKGGHFTWGDKELKAFLNEHDFSNDAALIKESVGLSAALFNYTWSFFWDYFPDAGYETHGTYKINDKRYPGSKGMIVRDFFNMAPEEIWGDVSELPDCKSITVATMYDTDKIYFKYSGRILNKNSLVSRINRMLILVDGKPVTNPKKVAALTQKIIALSQKQIDLVNGMDKLDLVRRGDKLAYYARKSFHLHFGKNWYSNEEVENTIQKFGTDFIDSWSEERNRAKNTNRDLYDPRNDFVPSMDA